MTEKSYHDAELEDRVFLATGQGGGGPAMTEEDYKKLIRDLWIAYCEMEGRYLAALEQKAW